MKKPDTKLHCPKCGKKRNTALYIQKKPEEEGGKPEIIPIRVGTLMTLLKKVKKGTREVELLQGGLFTSTCPQCLTTTLFRVKDRKLVMVEL
jgi:uncharacterized Zn finger protein (UPF0148 family)